MKNYTMDKDTRFPINYDMVKIDQVQVGVNKTVDQSKCIKKYHTAYKVMPPSICHVASFLAQKMAKELKSEDLLNTHLRNQINANLGSKTSRIQ